MGVHLELFEEILVTGAQHVGYGVNYDRISLQGPLIGGTRKPRSDSQPRQGGEEEVGKGQGWEDLS